jgi:hypothetical protein
MQSKSSFAPVAVVTTPPKYNPCADIDCPGNKGIGGIMDFAQGQAASLPTGLKIAGTVLVAATVGIMLLPVAAPLVAVALPSVVVGSAVGGAVFGSTLGAASGGAAILSATMVGGMGAGAVSGAAAGGGLAAFSQFLGFTY